MSTSFATVTDWLERKAPDVLAVKTPVVITPEMNDDGTEIEMFPPWAGS
jgi:hypothetical protein